MDFEDFRQRVQDERRVRAQRDAAEKNIAGERLRREIREAFARESAGELDENGRFGVPSLSTSGETLTIKDLLTLRARLEHRWDVAGQRTRGECRRGSVRRASRRRARGIEPRRARRVGVGA
jgi:hypothetical protein